MKNYIALIFVLALAFASCTKSNLIVEGNIIQTEAKSVTLEIIDGAKRTVLDKAKIVDGQFTLEANLKSKAVLGIYVEDELMPAKKLEGSSGNIKIVIDHKETLAQYEESRRVYGLQREFRQKGIEFNEKHEKLKSELRINKGMAKTIEEKKKAEKEFNEKLVALQAENVEHTITMIKENTHSLWGLRKLGSITGSITQKANLELIEMFRPHFANNPEFQMMDRYAKMEKMKMNEVAIDFTMKDVNGKDITLSDYKGKVVIVDFWASWCAPCRAQNPHVKELYKKYKSKGLEIIAVSLDEDEAAWKKAIKTDGLPWIHVSSLEGFECPVGFKYGVRAIPHVFILDRKGVLKGEKLHGPELEALVKELL